MKFKQFSVAIGFLALATTACSNDSKTGTASDELAKDLELAATSEGLSLASASNSKGQQVVSLAEQNKLTSKAPVAATRAPRPRRAAAPLAPEPEYVEEEEVEPEPEESAEVADNAPAMSDEPAAGSSPRPHPVGSGGYPNGGRGGTIVIGGNTGIGIGDIIGGVVIRGGGVDGDHCPPPGRRSRPPRSINDRIRIQGTYPGRWYSSPTGTGS